MTSTNQYALSCLSSTDIFNLHLNIEAKIKPEIAQYLTLPQAAVNKVLDIWNGYDPKINGCISFYRMAELKSFVRWTAEILDIEKNKIYEKSGQCFEQLTDAQSSLTCIQNAKAEFQQDFNQLMESRSTAYYIVNRVNDLNPWNENSSLSNVPLTKIMGGVAAVTCFAKAYQWHLAAQKLDVENSESEPSATIQHPKESSWTDQSTLRTKRNIAIAAGIVSIMVSAKDLFIPCD